MSPTERVRALLRPASGRWKPMFLGLAASAALAMAAVMAQAQPMLSVTLAGLALSAWYIGACAMVGFVRWFFATEAERLKREVERKGKP